MSDKPPANLNPALYVHRVHEVQTIARSCGYAIAIHGSMQRDLDVVAIPWVRNALSQKTLVKRLSEWFEIDTRPPSPRPHGRLAYTFLLGGGLFMDLSVMPRRK